LISTGARQGAHGPGDPAAADRPQAAGAKLRDVESSLRGILRGFGLKVGAVSKGKFEARIRELVAGQAMLERIAEPCFGRAPRCVPNTRACTASCAVDQPQRFARSKAVSGRRRDRAAVP
jgi:hypothetical protein